MSKASKILYNLVNHTFDPALRTKVWQWLVHPSNQKEKEEALLSIWNEYPTGANAETYHSLKTTQRKIRENQSPSKQYNLVHKLLRIAAILIIPLLSIAGSYLYIKQNTYNPELIQCFVPEGENQEVILPDLRFASEWLPTGTHATTTTPTKKAALGFLAKACLQTYEYGSTEYLQEALDTAKKLITDCETGGGKYNTYMYPSYSEVFKESNNWENKEALWKHRWYAGADGH